MIGRQRLRKIWSTVTIHLPRFRTENEWAWPAVLLIFTAFAYSGTTKAQSASSFQAESGRPEAEENIMEADIWGGANINVHVRLLWSMASPGLPKRQGYMEIWIQGAKFRVRDESGRHVAQIVGDIEAKRGLGEAPRSIEEMMDIRSLSYDETDRGVTELYGDLTTNQGLVVEPGQTPWPIEAEAIAPAAEQVLTDGLEEQLAPIGTVTRFERTCTEYHGFMEGEDSGAKYKSEITLTVSSPFVFLREVRNAANRDYYYVREVVDFEEGEVANADVMPPGAERTHDPE